MRIQLFNSLLLYVGTTSVVATNNIATIIEDATIPTFSLPELRRISELEERSEDFRQALSSNGLLAVKLDDDEDSDFFYPNDRRIALDGLCSCVDHPEFLNMDQTHELTLMGSSTSRTSVATATVGLENPLPLPKGMEETCGETVVDAMEGLRDVVASVSKTFVSALDASVVDNPSNSDKNSQTILRDEYGRSFKSVSEIVDSANHLEHFHVYTNKQAGSSSRISEPATAWDWHTDAGLFLVFVPAWDCNGGDSDESFYYRDTDGNTVRAKFDGGRTAIVMLGQGAQDWLKLAGQSQTETKKSPLLKATSHSVRWAAEGEEKSIGDNLPKQRRAWYGMMNLVPESALVYGGKTLRDVKQSLSLQHQHKNDFQLTSEITPSADDIPLGCGSVPVPQHVEESQGIEFEIEEVGATTRRRRHLQMQDGSICNNVTNFFCWMTCMDIPEVDMAPLYLEAGYSLYCVDEPMYKTTDNLLLSAEDCIDRHNSDCMGVWDKSDNVTAAELNIAAITHGSIEDIEYPFCYSGTTMYMEGFQWVQSSTCVIYLFPQWVLDTEWKYLLAVLGTVFLAIFLEKFIQQRRKAMATMDYGTKRLVASAGFYGIQLIIGYILMLIIMVYSVVLFMSVILGLVIGHVLFNARDAIFPVHDGSLVGEDQATGETNDDSEDNSRLEESFPNRNGTRNSFSIKSFEEECIGQGSTHCQIQSANDDNYGSIKTTSKNQRASKRKTIDQRISEGSTPCCQHGA